MGNTRLLAPPRTPRIPQHPPSRELLQPAAPCPPSFPHPAAAFPHISPHSPPAAAAGSGAGPRSTPGSPAARGRCPRPAAGRHPSSAQAWQPRCPGNQPGPRPPRPPRPPGTSPQPVGHVAVMGCRDHPQPPHGDGGCSNLCWGPLPWAGVTHPLEPAGDITPRGRDPSSPPARQAQADSQTPAR